MRSGCCSVPAAAPVWVAARLRAAAPVWVAARLWAAVWRGFPWRRILCVFRESAATFHDSGCIFTRALNRVFSALPKVVRLLAKEFARFFPTLGRQKQRHDNTAKRAERQSEYETSRILGHNVPFCAQLYRARSNSNFSLLKLYQLRT